MLIIVLQDILLYDALYIKNEPYNNLLWLILDYVEGDAEAHWVVKESSAVRH